MLSNKEIGLRIEQARKTKGLRLIDVAAQIHLAASTVQRYERGDIEKPKLLVIESIASVLDVSPAWLIGEAESPEIEKGPTDPETCGPAKASLLKAIDDMTEEELALLVSRAEAIKRSRV